MDVKELQNRIGYVFRNEELMENALTHSSYANERGKSRVFSNERLEFLGDSVLGFVTAEYLFEKYPSRPEGEMTRIRAELVCEHSLAATAEELELGAVLLLGKGEEQNGGRRRRSILADAVEALLAAIYLDGGMEPARAFVLGHILAEKPTELTDYKTALQERVQAAGGVSPQYRIIDEYGPDHAKTFVARVEIDGEPAGEGSGRTKKEAEQSAARAALESMDK
ncbi:MAG: ribonuclease III [Oscillospiraceae bacterium]|nr:ribonuclease III [Oscillospiraceae bacterium]